MDENIRYMFHPRSIAIIGASNKLWKVGHAVIANVLYGDCLRRDRTLGYKGKIYPVNPNEDNVFNLKCYPDVLSIPNEVDLAVVAVPAKFVPGVIEQCGQKGVKTTIIISAGFGETGDEGKRVEAEMVATARKYGMRILGPNCLGIYSLYEDLNTTFARAMPMKGPISFISQSGAFCASVIQYSLEEHFGFSNFVSIGNKSDIDDADIIEYFATDEHTKCIGMYIEALKDARKFLKVARELCKKVPMVALKSGRTEIGRSAAKSHTGSIAGNDIAYEAMFRQTGIYRARTMSELFDAARALAYQPPPPPEGGIAILTNSGGPGVVATDAASDLGLPLAKLSDATIAELNRVCPPEWSHRNPVDILGDASPDRYSDAIHVLLEAGEVSGLIVITAPQAMTDPETLAKRIVEAAKGTTKPVIASFVGMISSPAENYVEEQGIPEMSFPEDAVLGMHALVHRSRILRREQIWQ